MMKYKLNFLTHKIVYTYKYFMRSFFFREDEFIPTRISRQYIPFFFNFKCFLKFPKKKNSEMNQTSTVDIYIYSWKYLFHVYTF